jgi:hypothetical protein
MTKLKGGAIVDLGNVIVAHWLSNITPENFLTIDYNSIPEAPGVCESLKRINERFGGNVTVVYNSTGIADEKIRIWLETHTFTQRTGIPSERICRTTHGRDKTPFVEQSTCTHYGTTVVVDDRLEVVSKFVGKVPEQSMEMNGSTHLKFWDCNISKVFSEFITESLDKSAKIFVSFLEARFVFFVGESKE